MSVNDYIVLATFAFTLLSALVYFSSRFVRLETDVHRIKTDMDDITKLKEKIYEIHAQNKLLLSMRYPRE